MNQIKWEAQHSKDHKKINNEQTKNKTLHINTTKQNKKETINI